MTKLTHADILEAHARYYNSREKTAVVGAAYGVDRSALVHRFKRLGLPRRPQNIRRTEMTLNELIEVTTHAKAGASLETLSYNLDMDIKTLRRILRDAGFETDARKRRQHETTD
jgi:hypothetical protein